MAKAHIDCANCGATVIVEGRNNSEAARKAKQYKEKGHLCRNCEDARLKQENIAAAASNRECNYSTLTGTENQILWAESIRKKMLDSMIELRPFLELEQRRQSIELINPNSPELDVLDGQSAALLNEIDENQRYFVHSIVRNILNEISSIDHYDALISLLREESRASWWIDERSTGPAALAKSMKGHIADYLAMHASISADEAAVIEEAQAEALLKPTGGALSHQVAEISLVGNELRVAFPEKIESFRLLMRGLGFRWSDRYWARMLGVTTGADLDRQAEVAHDLLTAGFMVRLHSTEARAKAIAGNFDLEKSRWVTMCQYSGQMWFCIRWPRCDEFYGPARRIPGSRYENRSMYVPLTSAIEVADFAETYDFSMSPAATAAVEDRQRELSRGIIVDHLKEPINPVRVENGGVPPILSIPDNSIIDAGLRDDFYSDNSISAPFRT